MEEATYSKTNEKRKEHPVEKANIITKLFFCWLLPYFVKGYKKEITEDDMYGALKTHEASRLGDKLHVAWNYEVTHKRNPTLWIPLIKVFGVELVLYALFFVFNEFVAKYKLIEPSRTRA